MCRHVKCRMLSTEGQFETIKGFKRIDLLNRKTGNIRVCPGWAISTMMTDHRPLSPLETQDVEVLALPPFYCTSRHSGCCIHKRSHASGAE